MVADMRSDDKSMAEKDETLEVVSETRMASVERVPPPRPNVDGNEKEIKALFCSGK